jgi:hypothetical protein
MIKHLSVDTSSMQFTFFTEYASCDCTVARHDQFKLTVENKQIFGRPYDHSDLTHRDLNKMLGDQLTILCTNNFWKLWDF